MMFFKGRNTNDAIIKSEFTPLQMSEGVYYLQTRDQSEKVWLTYADLMLPFCYGLYGDRFNIVYSAGGSTATFPVRSMPDGVLGQELRYVQCEGPGLCALREGLGRCTDPSDGHRGVLAGSVGRLRRHAASCDAAVMTSVQVCSRYFGCGKQPIFRLWYCTDP